MPPPLRTVSHTRIQQIFPLSLLLLAVPVASPAQGLTVEQAVSDAWAQRGMATLAAARVAEGDAQARAAGAWGNPTGVAQYTGSAPRRHAEIDQPLDRLFTRGPDIRAARFDASGARADSLAVARALRREVTDAYFATVAARAALESALRLRAASDSLSAFAGARYAAGDISQLDRDAALLDGVRAARAALQAGELREASEAELLRAMGSSAAVPADLSTPLDAALDETTGLPVVADLAPLSQAAPEVRAAWADSAAAAWRLRGAARGWIPAPTLQAGAEWDDPAAPGAGRQLLLGVSLPLPLWDHGGAESAAAQARLAQAAARLREARLNAMAEGRTRAARLIAARLRALSSRDRAAPLAAAIRARAVRAYHAGQTGMIPVLDALRAERETVQDALSDSQEFQAARAAWLAWAGRE